MKVKVASYATNYPACAVTWWVCNGFEQATFGHQWFLSTSVPWSFDPEGGTKAHL